MLTIIRTIAAIYAPVLVAGAALYVGALLFAG